MQLDHNKITKSDRACVNCKFLKRRWTFVGIVDLIMSKFISDLSASGHFHCSQFDPVTETNMVTGKQKIVMRTQPCVNMRNSHYCGSEASSWKPSDRWLKDPKNLFKILTDQEKDAK